MQKVFLSLVAVFFLHAVRAQYEEKDFIRYTKPDGLSNNYITGVIQDSLGYLWIATLYGLNRFDGSTFKQYLHYSRYNPIPDNDIYSVQSLRGNEIGIATSGGAQIISTKTLQAKALQIPVESDLRYWSESIQYINADHNGNYGVSTKTGFYVFSPGGKLIKRLDRYTAKDIGHSWMLFGRQVHCLPDGNMLQINTGGVIVYDRGKNIFTEVPSQYAGLKKALPLKNYIGLTFITPTKFLILNAEKNSFDLTDLYSGESNSYPACFSIKEEISWQTKLSKLNDSVWALNCNPKEKGFYLLTIPAKGLQVTCDPKKYFRNYFCNIIYADKERKVWIGTAEGLWMQKRDQRIIDQYNLAPGNELPVITSLFVSETSIFAGTNQKEIWVLDRQSGKPVRRILLNGPHYGNETSIRCIRPVHKDTLWVGTDFGLWWFHNKNYSFGRIILPGLIPADERAVLLFNDSRKNTWVTTSDINQIYFYNWPKRQWGRLSYKEFPLLKVNLATSMAEDNAGNIWFGGDAIARWNPQKQQVDTLINSLPQQRTRKKGFEVKSDEKGDIWVAMNDDGVAKITGPSSPLYVRNENIVYASPIFMKADLFNDRMFIFSNNNIGILNTQNLQSIVYGYENGVPDKPVSTTFFTHDPSDSSVWFACQNIICRLPYMKSHDLKSPLLNISEAYIVNDTLINHPAEVIKLHHSQNDIQLSVSAINYTDPQNMRFAYRLLHKKDSSWIETGNPQNILLTNISPGVYDLEIKVRAFDNKWPEQIKRLQIVIHTPYWKTSWFIVLIGLAILGVGYILYRHRIKGIRQKADIDKQLAQTEMKALHAQMNPHFIFNSLNSIREMILMNENKEASHFLGKFAHLIRMTLDQSGQSFISLRNTMEYLTRYIEMEQIRNSHFTSRILADDELDSGETVLPPMLIQPFVENAIWHGTTGNQKNININIDFKKQGNQLVCIIEDNGIGISQSLKDKKNSNDTHHSVGIENVNNRIRLLNEKYNLQSSVSIEDKNDLPGYTGTGTVVTLRIPLEINE